MKVLLVLLPSLIVGALTVAWRYDVRQREAKVESMCRGLQVLSGRFAVPMPLPEGSILAFLVFQQDYVMDLYERECL